MSKYRLLDAGNQKKVEKLGDYKILRPCPQALWKPYNNDLWQNADFEYIKTDGEKGVWKNLSGKKLPSSWVVTSEELGVEWRVEPNEFGNIGIFTEHWTYSKDLLGFFDKQYPVLDLFSYSGSNVMYLIKNGFRITAVDSSRAAMDDFTTNLALNKFAREGHKLVLEDCQKYISREERRGKKYQNVIIDSPSFGRGTKGEVFKIEENLVKMLKTVNLLLESDGRLILTLHSPRFTPMILNILLRQIFSDKEVETSEILNPCESGVSIPSGFLVKIY
jgi:23S rRNA (cytosine1962-C5)-methyltransferase